MAPNLHVMRQEVSDLYPGPRWKHRVAHMPEAQIIAIYFREKPEREPTVETKESKNGEQQTLF